MLRYVNGRIEGKDMVSLVRKYMSFKSGYGEDEESLDWIVFDYDEKNGVVTKKEHSS